MKIYNFGSLNVDRVYKVKDFVRAGETILSKDLNFFPGGKGLNQSIACKKAGGEVYHVGNIGADGEILKECLKENKVPMDFLRELNGAGGHAVIQVSETGQNAIIVYGGTNQRMDSDFIDSVVKTMASGDIVLMQNEINNIPEIIRKAKAAGAYVVINPSPITEELLSYPLESVDLFILNEIEGAALTGKEAAEDILSAMKKRFPAADILLTRGGDGSCYCGKEGEFRQGIFPATVVDTTAAGDTYCGYFLSSIAQGKAVPEAMKLASAAASIAVSRAGAAVSIPTIDEVESFL